MHSINIGGWTSTLYPNLFVDWHLPIYLPLSIFHWKAHLVVQINVKLGAKNKKGMQEH
jgi:hypothetical protein